MPLATAVTAGLPAALPSDLPGALAPTLGPKWLDAASIITTIVEWFGPWAIVGVMLIVVASEATVPLRRRILSSVREGRE